MKMTQDEFLQAYAKYKNTVYSVIFNYVKNNEDANDLQQEVFIRLLKSEADFDGEEITVAFQTHHCLRKSLIA